MSTDASISHLMTNSVAAPQDRAFGDQEAPPSVACGDFDKRDWLLLTILGLLTFALFIRAARFEFLGYDDVPYLINNAHLAAGLKWSSIRWALTNSSDGNWIPLTLLL